MNHWILWTCLLMPIGYADQDPPQAEPPAAEDAVAVAVVVAHVVVKTVAEDALTGRLLRISTTEGVTLRLHDGAERRIPLAEIVRIEAAAPAPRPFTPPLTVDLTGGDRLRGTVIEYGDAGVTLRLERVGDLSIPLDRIRRWRPNRDGDGPLTPPAGEADGFSSPGWSAGRAGRAGVDTSPTPGGSLRDVIRLTNSDTLRGIITRIDQEGFHIELDAGVRVVPHDVVRVAELVAAEDRSADGELTVRIRTVDGHTFVTTRIEGPTDGVLELEAAGHELALPIEAVEAIDVLGGTWVWLMNLSPSEFRHTPMLSIAWPYRIGRNVRGGPLRVVGRDYEQGIGVHSASTLVYDLGGQFDSFVTSFGLDDDAGLLADVVVEIRVDGRVDYRESGVVRGALYGPVRLDVRGGQRLELIVGFGRRGAIQDRFDWIEPALVRPSAPGPAQ